MPSRDIPIKVDRPARRKLFELVRISEIEVTPPDWLVKGLLERDTLSCFFGDPASGKSFAALDLAFHVATGRPWHGRAVKSGPAVFIAGEGLEGVIRRKEALCNRYQIERSDLDIFISKAPALLCEDDVVDAIAAELEELAAVAGSPALIVVDTLGRNFGGDENATADMHKFVAACDRLRLHHRPTILIVHHSGHADKSRSRGNTALKAALDVEYQFTRGVDGVIRVACTKAKDFIAPDDLAFKLRPVELDIQDDDGLPITSAVLERVEFTLPPDRQEAGGKNQDKALQVLRELDQLYARNLVAAGRDPAVGRIEITAWRDACKAKGMAPKRFREARTALEKRGAVLVNGIHVSLVADDG